MKFKDVFMNPGTFSHLSQPAKLRARIMASGYQYMVINDETNVEIQQEGGDQVGYACLTTVKWLQRLLALMMAVCFILLIALIAVAASNDDDDDDTKLETMPCVNEECIQASSYILKNMNRSVDPCEDMFEYACGTWISETSLPQGVAKWNRFSEVAAKNNEFLKTLLENEVNTFKGQNSSAVYKLKTYYNTCMDEETIEKQGISRIQQIIDKLGGWTVVGTSNVTGWDNTTWSLQGSLQETHKLGTRSLFAISVSPDAMNTKTYMIYISQSGLTLSHENQYFGNSSEKYKAAYLAFATRVGVLLGGEEDDVSLKMEQVYEFEKKLAKIFVPRENLTDPKSTYNKMSLSDLQDKLGSWINIITYFTDSFMGRKTFTKEDEIVVSVPAYFDKLGSVVSGTRKEVLANYLMWRMVSSVTGYLPNEFSKAELELYRVETGVKELQPRWKRCMGKAKSAVPFAGGALYVDKKFSAESRTRALAVLHDVQKAFISNLPSVTWLDEVTRAKLKGKAEYVTFMVGYPDWIMDVSKLDERYDKLTVQQGEFLANLISVIQYSRNSVLDKFSDTPDRTEWEMAPDQVNAYYNPMFNTIALPAGILQPPFFTPEFPDSFLYGTIGMISGHELTHGFDNSGRQYDKYGNMGNNMWTEDSEEAFQAESQCMVDQYSSYSVLGHQLNGIITLGENIADNGGLKFGYEAFTARQTPPSNLPALNLKDEQLFFLGFSQVWCSKETDNNALQSIDTAVHTNNRYRVIGTLQNSREFASAFGCSHKSFLNPEKKCRVW